MTGAYLHAALCAIKLPLSNFLFSADSACADPSSSSGATGMVADHPDEPPTQTRRRGQGQGQEQQRVPPQAFSPACALVLSAVNNNIIQRTLGFLPPLALAMTEQTSHFFRGMPTTLPPLPPLPPPPPSRVEVAVRGALKAVGLEGRVARRPGESWGELLRFVQRPPAKPGSRLSARLKHALDRKSTRLNSSHW